MSNVFDYIAWRGDLSFAENPMCEVDNFIFCMATYIEYNRIFNNYNPDVKISIKDIAKEFCKIYDAKTVKRMSIIIPWKNIRKLIAKMGQSTRFGNLFISDFTNEIDREREMQFSAVTYHLTPNEMFVCFRGTDETLEGWKEDLRLSYLSEVPAQKRAAEYLETVAKKYPSKKIYVGGHSKGGNLAKYSCLCASDGTLARVAEIYNNDGPGFLHDVVSPERFVRVEKKVKNFVPQSSLIGQMFQHHGQRIIVKSNYKGVYQHDIFGWEIKGRKAVTMTAFTKTGEINHEIFNTRIYTMSLDERREFVDIFCQILNKSGAKTVRELTELGFKSAAGMLRAYAELDKEKKQLMQVCITRLLDSQKHEDNKKGVKNKKV